MLAKHIGDIWQILVSEVICWSVNKTFCLQFLDALLTHLSLDQFGLWLREGVK